MYKYKDFSGRRANRWLWIAVITLAAGEFVLLGLLMNQNRMMHTMIGSLSEQLGELKRMEPIEKMNRQINSINRSVNGLVEIVGTQKLNPDQHNRLVEMSGQTRSTKVVPAQSSPPSN